MIDLLQHNIINCVIICYCRQSVQLSGQEHQATEAAASGMEVPSPGTGESIMHDGRAYSSYVVQSGAFHCA